jgi:hypothetical protein
MDLHMSLIDMLPGDSLDMVVHRGDKKLEMTVKLGKRKTEK